MQKYFFMEIKHYAGSNNGIFELENNGEPVAEIVYQRSGDGGIIINHTGVERAYRGQHLAQQLVAEIAEFARRENLKITPLCSYAKAIMERNPDYSDVLK